MLSRAARSTQHYLRLAFWCQSKSTYLCCRYWQISSGYLRASLYPGKGCLGTMKRCVEELVQSCDTVQRWKLLLCNNIAMHETTVGLVLAVSLADSARVAGATSQSRFFSFASDDPVPQCIDGPECDQNRAHRFNDNRQHCLLDRMMWWSRAFPYTFLWLGESPCSDLAAIPLEAANSNGSYHMRPGPCDTEGD